MTLSEKIADMGLVEAKEAKKLMLKVRAGQKKFHRGFPGITGFINNDEVQEGYVNGTLLVGRALTDAYVAAFCKQNSLKP